MVGPDAGSMAGPGPAAPRWPFRGKSFYLDLPSGRSAQELEAAIGRLGGVTESFLSKEISCVVSSHREAKGCKGRTWPEKRSHPTPADAKATSLMSPASRGNHTTPPHKPLDAALISRGRELLQKAMKNQDTCSGSSILANARLWGVQVVHVDEMLSYTQKLLRAGSGARRRCQKPEAKSSEAGLKAPKGKLKPPFLKVEDQSRQFQPFHHHFKSFPTLNFLAPKTSSPFEPLKSTSNSCRARAAKGCPTCSTGKRSPRSTPVTAPKRKRGFCECCQETFEELQKHLQSPQHESFALDARRYQPVDRVISQLCNSLLEWAPQTPQSCLTDEHLGIRGAEMLRAEPGKGREQPEPEAAEPSLTPEHSQGPKSCSPWLPGNRVRDPGEREVMSNNCPVGLPAGAGVSGGVCAVPGTSEEAVVRGRGLVLAAAATGVQEVTAASSEPPEQQELGTALCLPAALPASRKRQPSFGQSSQLGKKPRLELGAGLSPGEQTAPVGAGMSGQGAEWETEPGLPAGVETGSWPQGAKLPHRPGSSCGLDSCPCGDPAAGLGSPEAVAEGSGPSVAAAAECGRSRANLSSGGKQLRGDKNNTARNVPRPGLESTMGEASCPAGQLPSPELPVAEARCCCSLCGGAAEKIAADLPNLLGPGEKQVPCPGILQPLPQTDHFSRSSSESDWDVQLLSTLTGSQGGRIQAVDRDLLQRTHLNVRDSEYESQLSSVLKQKSELAWAGREDKNCWNCCTETRGASFPILETFFDSWTS